jgi:hypothetical protein
MASKKRYFYGLKVHLLVTKDGQPVECFLTPGSYSDVRMLKTFRFDVPEGSHVYRIKPIMTMSIPLQKLIRPAERGIAMRF